MKQLFCLLSVLCTLTFLTQCASTNNGNSTKKPKAPTENRLGYVMPKYNFSIDGDYNTQTAHLIPGYTAVTVAIANKGFNPILLQPDKDRWRIKDRKGKWHKAVNEIQYEAPELWEKLQDETQKMIAYPAMVPPGYTQTFSLFFPGEVNLAGFKAIEFYSASWEKKLTFKRY